MKRRMMATALLAVASLSVGCHNKMGTCPGGNCGLAAGGCPDCGVTMGDCNGGSCQATPPIDAYGANANYEPNGGRGGVLAALHGRNHGGPQSHMGSDPGPAMGPSSPTYGYPYYTTRGPRDFLNPNPPSIGP